MPKKPGPEQIRFAARFVLYFFLILIGTYSYVPLTRRYGVEVFSESGLIEWSHATMMALSSVIFLVLGLRDEIFRGLHVVFCALTALVCVREFDAALDRLLPGGWQTAASLVLLAAITMTIKNWSSFKLGASWMIGSYVFVLFWAGFVVAVPFAQFVGHGPLLRLFMTEDYTSAIKRLIEESAEQLGYFMILLGAIETAIRRQDQS